MRARSSLSESQREQLVDLFEQGLSYRAAAHRLGVGLYPVKRFERRFKLHGRLCLVDKLIKQHLRNKEGSCRSVHRRRVQDGTG